MNKRNNGFTLVEFNVAAAISLITLTAVLALYLFSWRNFAIGNALLDVYSSSRNASGWLTRDIRCAAMVDSSYTSGGITYTTTDNSIVLLVPSIDKLNPPNILSGCSDHIIYQLNGSDLRRIVIIDDRFKDPGNIDYFNKSGRSEDNRIIANNCESLTFSSNGVGLSLIANLSDTVNTVSIYLPINKSTVSLGGVGTHVASINPTTVVRLRNK